MRQRLVYLNLAIPLIVFLIPAGKYAAHVIGWVVVIPSLLVVLNVALYITKHETSWLKCCVLMWCGLTMAQVVGYLAWGVSAKQLLSPDAETVAIGLALAKYYAGLTLGVYLLGVVVEAVRKRWRASA